MRRKFVRRTAMFLAAMMVFLAFSGECAVAAKAKLKTKRIVLKKGEEKQIRIAGKNNKAKYSYTVKKKEIVLVSKKGLIKAKKAGETTIVVTEEIISKGKKKTRKVGTLNVLVKKNSAVPSAKPAVTNAPEATSPSEVTTPPTVEKTAEPDFAPLNSVAPGQTLKPATESSIPKTWIDDDTETPEGFDKKKDGVTYGKVQTITYYSFVAEKNRKAKVILPPNYDKSKEYPVLYLLHGIGGDENEWMGGSPDKIVGNMIAAGTAKEMIMVLPNQLVQIPGETMPGYYLDPGRFVMFDRIVEELKTSLMPFIENNYPVKPGRDNRAVAGLSMGGREAIHTGIDLIEDIAYMGAFTPAVGVLPYETEKGLFTTETLTIPEEYRPISMFMIVAGDNDTVVWDNPKKYSDVLKANGVDHLFYNCPGGHSFVAWKNGLYNFARRIFQN